MPTYEYQCEACGHQLEAFQKMTDEPLKECPKCHQESLNKLISASGFQLKGTGWYVTDYRKDKSKSTSSSDGSSDSKDSKGSSGSSNDSSAV